MDVTRRLLNGATLPKSLWGEMGATVVFLLKRLLIARHSDNAVNEVRKTLIDKFTMMNVGDETRILGIGVIQENERDTISINQGRYVL